MQSNPRVNSPRQAAVSLLKSKARKQTGNIEGINPLQPAVRLRIIPGQPRKLLIEPLCTLQGEMIARLPFRFKGADWTQTRPSTVFVSDTWTVDLDEDTVDTQTFIGGRIDGLPLEPMQDYFIWGLSNDINKRTFEGYAFTRRPVDEATLITIGGGGFGSTSDFSVVDSSQFSELARFVLRVDDSIDSDYNQGTILEIIDATTVKVKLDQSYGAILQSNTLIGAGLFEIRQLDCFEPTSNVPPMTAFQAYTYIGQIQTDMNSDIMFVRMRGDLYSLPAQIIIYDSLITSVTDERVCFARILPIGGGRVDVLGQTTKTFGGGNDDVSMELGPSVGFREVVAGEIRRVGQTTVDTGITSLRAYDTSIVVSTFLTGVAESQTVVAISSFINKDF